MNHCEAHLMVTSGEIDSEELRNWDGNSVGVFFLIRQNGTCNVTQFLFGMGPDVQVYKVCVLKMT